MVVNLAEAKAHLSELVDAAANGKVVVIARRNVPLVRLQAVPVRPKKSAFGILRGKIELSPDFDEPLEEFRPYRK